eukprot:scaffold391_cov223-Pinguiococcus_pyrenoidosus.AAC.3
MLRLHPCPTTRQLSGLDRRLAPLPRAQTRLSSSLKTTLNWGARLLGDLSGFVAQTLVGPKC